VSLVLQIVPFLAWVAVVTSAVLLALLWSLGDLGRGGAGVLLGWFLLAVWFQFLGASALLQAAGLALQTLLAVCLLIRWKASG
jgi:hypothetical protein